MSVALYPPSEPTSKQLLRARIDDARRRQLGLQPRDRETYCRGTTKLGESCRWRAQASGYCHWHERQQLAVT